MVKKLLALAFFAFIPLTTLYAYDPTDNTRATPDWMTATRMKNGSSTVTFRVDHFGNIRPGEDNANIIGSTEARYRRLYVGDIDASTGIVNMHEAFLDVALSSDSNFNPQPI